MRLGTYPAQLAQGLGRGARRTARRAVDERHRHRYEVNNAYRERLAGRRARVLRARRPDGTLVEFVELPADVHPYYVATQAHPEFLSRPNRAHPLFAGLIGAALRRQQAGRLVEVPLRDDDPVGTSMPSLIALGARARGRGSGAHPAGGAR